MWYKNTISSCLSYYLGACHLEAETHGFSMRISTANSDNEAHSREDHIWLVLHSSQGQPTVSAHYIPADYMADGQEHTDPIGYAQYPCPA